MDPLGLKVAIEKLASSLSLPTVCVAALHGDDIHSNYNELRGTPGAIVGFSPFGDREGKRVEETESLNEFLSVNAYVGAGGICEALARYVPIILSLKECQV